MRRKKRKIEKKNWKKNSFDFYILWFKFSFVTTHLLFLNIWFFFWLSNLKSFFLDKYKNHNDCSEKLKSFSWFFKVIDVWSKWLFKELEYKRCWPLSFQNTVKYFIFSSWNHVNLTVEGSRVQRRISSWHTWQIRKVLFD